MHQLAVDPRGGWPVAQLAGPRNQHAPDDVAPGVILNLLAQGPRRAQVHGHPVGGYHSVLQLWRQRSACTCRLHMLGDVGKEAASARGGCRSAQSVHRSEALSKQVQRHEVIGDAKALEVLDVAEQRHFVVASAPLRLRRVFDVHAHRDVVRREGRFVREVGIQQERPGEVQKLEHELLPAAAPAVRPTGLHQHLQLRPLQPLLHVGEEAAPWCREVRRAPAAGRLEQEGRVRRCSGLQRDRTAAEAPLGLERLDGARGVQADAGEESLVAAPGLCPLEGLEKPVDVVRTQLDVVLQQHAHLAGGGGIPGLRDGADEASLAHALEDRLGAMREIQADREVHQLRRRRRLQIEHQRHIVGARRILGRDNGSTQALETLQAVV
eukprot:scaffold1499_cov255-Pinguiococcus_pyrenoidosus.AAC.26